MQTQSLADIPLFSTLPKDEIEHLETTLPSVSIPAGRILFEEGFTDDKFFILIEGEVEIIKSLGKEEERILAVRGSGNLLGEMSLFSQDGRHTASVRALTPLWMLQVTHAELDALLRRQPRLAYELIKLFSLRLEESENITIIDLREKNRRLRQAYDELNWRRNCRFLAKFSKVFCPKACPLFRAMSLAP
jgi:CRP-like cAMP-binding protein